MQGESGTIVPVERVDRRSLHKIEHSRFAGDYSYIVSSWDGEGHDALADVCEVDFDGGRLGVFVFVLVFILVLVAGLLFVAFRGQRRRHSFLQDYGIYATSYRMRQA